MCVPGLNLPCLIGVVSLMNSTRSGVDAAVVRDGGALRGRARSRRRACPRPSAACSSARRASRERSMRLREAARRSRASCRPSSSSTLRCAATARRHGPRALVRDRRSASTRRGRPAGSTSMTSMPCWPKRCETDATREVERVLVVDLVVRDLLDDVAEVRVLEHDDALRASARMPDALDDRVDVRDVAHHVGGDERVGLPVLGDDRARGLLVEELGRSCSRPSRARPRRRWPTARRRGGGCRRSRSCAA